jgi:hypothetical protein
MSAVLKRADRNLYASKGNGKDRVYLDGAPVFHRSMSTPEAL